MIAATEKNIEWLIERLYVASRELQVREINDLVFVLLTKGLEDRIRVEQIFFEYFHRVFGLWSDEHVFKNYFNSSSASAFTLPNLRARIMLMDI